MSQLKTGMDAMMAMNKTIEEDVEETQNTKIVKLRFTRKQYQTFRDACKMFEIVSNHPEFNSLVSKAFSADIKVPTIAKTDCHTHSRGTLEHSDEIAPQRKL